MYQANKTKTMRTKQIERKKMKVACMMHREKRSFFFNFFCQAYSLLFLYFICSLSDFIWCAFFIKLNEIYMYLLRKRKSADCRYSSQYLFCHFEMRKLKCIHSIIDSTSTHTHTHHITHIYKLTDCVCSIQSLYFVRPDGARDLMVCCL